MKRIALILLLCCSTVIGAEFFVSTSGNDTTGDGTEAKPEQTIGAAIGDVVAAGAGTHTIYVKSGTYAGAYYTLGSVPDGTTLTIQGYKTVKTDGASADLGADRPLIATTDAVWCLYRSCTSPNVWAGSSLTLRNLRFAPPNLGTQSMIRWGSTADNAPDASLTIEYCAFTIPASCNQGIINTQTVVGTTSTRAITLRNCTITGHSGAGVLVSLYEVGQVTLENVTVTGGTANNGHLVYLRDTATGLDIRNCNVGTIGGSFVTTGTSTALTSIVATGNSATCKSFLYCPNGVGGGTRLEVTDNTASIDGYGIYVGAAYTNEVISGYWRNGVITGNSMIRTGTGGGHAMMLGLNVTGAEVAGNTFKGLSGAGTKDFGAVIKSSGIYFHHNYCWGRYAIYLCSGSYNHIVHNTAYGTDTYAFAWSANANDAQAGAKGTNNATTDGSTGVVTIGSATDLSKVRVGDSLYITDQTAGIDGTAFFTITAVDDPNDTITVTPIPAAASNKTWDAYAPPPYDNVVMDNIFVAGADGEAVATNAVGALSGMHGRIRMDSNLYYGGSNGITGYGGQSQATLALAQAEWGKVGGAWDDASTLNDDNSLAANPLLLDMDTGRVSLVSPAIGAGSDGMTIGAWQPVPVRRPQRIGF